MPFPSIVGRVYDICQSAPHLEFHVETGPAEDRVTLDARMAKAIWNELDWEGVLRTWRLSFSATNRPVGRLAYPIPYRTNQSSGKVGARCIQDGHRLRLSGGLG